MARARASAILLCALQCCVLCAAPSATIGVWDDFSARGPARSTARTDQQPQRAGADDSSTTLSCPTAPRAVPLPEQLPAEIETILSAARGKLDQMWTASKAAGGSAAVVYGDRVLMTHTFGSTASQGGHAVDGDTVFRLGSVTKVFTDLMLHRMAEDSLLHATDPITSLAPEYSPAWPGAANGSAPTPKGGTLRDLGSHMAGLPRALPCPLGECNYTTAEIMQVMNNWTLLAEPGTKLTYSNVGFALLGRLLERVDAPRYSPKGESWEDSMNKLAQVLGMGNTTARAPTDTSNLAYGLQWGQPAPLVDLGWGNPCGSVYSSANDMARLLSFLLRDGAARDDTKAQPLDSATTRRWLHDRVLSNPSNLACENCIEFTEWGETWHVMRANIVQMGNFSQFYIVTKDGGIPGYNSYIALQPELKLAIFAGMTSTVGGYAPFFSQVPNILGFDIVPQVYEYLLRHQPSLLPPTPSDFVGNYTLVTSWGKFERLNYFYVARYKNGGPAGDVLYGRASSEAIGPPMCLSFPGCPLGWKSGDNLKMLPEPTASCTLTEEGDQYNVHFSRGANGEVVSLRIEGEGIGTGNAELKRQPREWRSD